MGKTGRKNKVYSAGFKISVIMDMCENYLSQRETVRKYWNTQNRTEEDKYLRTLKNWKHIYLEEGAEGLMKERRGRDSANGKKRGRPPKHDKKVEEDLIAENQRLRMEIEYLKKLSALVLAEEQKSGKKRK